MTNYVNLAEELRNKSENYTGAWWIILRADWKFCKEERRNCVLVLPHFPAHMARRYVLSRLFSFSLNIFPPNPKKFPLKITHNIPSARANLLLCLLGCLSAKLPVSKNLCHWVIAPPANWPASGSLDTPIAVTVERSNLVDCNDIHVAVALSDILLKFGI